MDTTGYTIPYVSTWAARVDGNEPAEVVKATGERVRKTALAILDQLDTNQITDGVPPGLNRGTPARQSSTRAQTPASLPEPALSPAAPVAVGREL